MSILRELPVATDTDDGGRIAYEALMRTKEAFRIEAARLARELAEARDALRPFARLADVCDHFAHLPDKPICSYRIAGKRHDGPTACDLREARRVYEFVLQGRSKIT